MAPCERFHTLKEWAEALLAEAMAEAERTGKPMVARVAIPVVFRPECDCPEDKKTLEANIRDGVFICPNCSKVLYRSLASTLRQPADPVPDTLPFYAYALRVYRETAAWREQPLHVRGGTRLITLTQVTSGIKAHACHGGMVKPTTAFVSYDGHSLTCFECGQVIWQWATAEMLNPPPPAEEEEYEQD